MDAASAQLAVFAVVLAGLLTAIAWIDQRRQIIPDGLNLALALAGLALVLLTVPEALPWRLAGAGVIAGLLYLLRWWHFRRRGLIGLGLGDVKFAAAAALWLAPEFLPLFILAASLLALGYAVFAGVLATPDLSQRRIAFGPFLAGGLLLVWTAQTMSLIA